MASTSEVLGGPCNLVPTPNGAFNLTLSRGTLYMANHWGYK